MSETAGPIRRRKRTAPEPIAEGERKSITFLADAKTYNHLVNISRESGRTISELVEIHLSKSATGQIRPKFEDVFFGSAASLELLRIYALILSALGPAADWEKNEETRASVCAAIEMANKRLLPIDEAKLIPDPETGLARSEEIRNAIGVGRLLGSTLSANMKLSGLRELLTEGAFNKKDQGK